MTSTNRGHGGGEQLVVFWTWLLEGYIPVAPIVADLDELDAGASAESGATPREEAQRARAQPAHVKAA